MEKIETEFKDITVGLLCANPMINSSWCLILLHVHFEDQRTFQAHSYHISCLSEPEFTVSVSFCSFLVKIRNNWRVTLCC